MIDQKNSEKRLETSQTYELPLGSVLPSGWYGDILRLQADNFTGILDEHWDSVGSYSAWLGGTGENWERGPYYLDGLLPLAYLLEDDQLRKKAQKWVEWTLSSQDANGNFGPKNNSDWWPRMVMLKVLMQYSEVSKDIRVIPFMEKYAQFLSASMDAVPLSSWGMARGGEFIMWLFWLVRQTGKSDFLALAKRVYAQTLDWASFCTQFPFIRPTSFYFNFESNYTHFSMQELTRTHQFLFTHIVNVAMGLKTPTIFSLLTGDPIQRNAMREGAYNLQKYHGVVTRMFTGDEHLAGAMPSQGTELCAVVEYMFSLETVLDVYGDTWAADTLETIAFNALPATITGDFRGHQYLQQANQICVSKAKRNWYNNNDESILFGLEPNFGCCAANLHQGWPKLSKSFWRGTVDGGFAAFVYAPNILDVELTSGQQLCIRTSTNYPFEEIVRFQIEIERPEGFPLKFRIPAWCEGAILTSPDGTIHNNESGTWTSINRIWSSGDVIELLLPMTLRSSFWFGDSVGMEFGPLVLALRMDEKWIKTGGYSVFPDQEIESDSPWNYALKLTDRKPREGVRVERHAMRDGFSFSRECLPLSVFVPARKVPAWVMERNSAAEPPVSPLAPVALGADEELIELIPYGFARLRVSQFPWYRAF